MAQRRWITVLPNKRGSITIAMNYGSQQFAHGDYIFSEALANAYPEYFVEFPVVDEIPDNPPVENINLNALTDKLQEQLQEDHEEELSVDELYQLIQSLQTKLQAKVLAETTVYEVKDTPVTPVTEKPKRGRPASKFPKVK